MEDVWFCEVVLDMLVGMRSLLGPDRLACVLYQSSFLVVF